MKSILLLTHLQVIHTRYVSSRGGHRPAVDEVGDRITGQDVQRDLLGVVVRLVEGRVHELRPGSRQRTVDLDLYGKGPARGCQHRLGLNRCPAQGFGGVEIPGPPIGVNVQLQTRRAQIVLLTGLRWSLRC